MNTSCFKTLTIVLTFWSKAIVRGYPLISEVDSGAEKCFNFLVPPHDDAHLSFVALRSSGPSEVDEYYVALVSQLVKEAANDPETVPAIPETPDNIKTMVKDAGEGDPNSGVFLQIKKPDKPLLRHQLLKYNTPVVIQSLRKRAADAGHGDDENFIICFKNTNSWREQKDVDIVFDSTLEDTSEDDDPEVNQLRKKMVRKTQMDPLETSLDEIITKAEDILEEFKYMERRERRMRKTADSTNTRVRYFSYLSILVLLGVTLIQVLYLQSYFRKKKLM